MGAEKKEIWKQRRKQHKQEEAKCLVGVEFSGANTQTEQSLEKKKTRQKCVEHSDICIPTLNEQRTQLLICLSAKR